jgi:hypothetical protein
MGQSRQPDPAPAVRVLQALVRRAGMAVLLFVLVSAFWWKLTLTNQYTWLNGFDLSNQVLPWFQFQAGALHQGELPLWDPYHWFGQPVLGQVQTGAAYPLNWVLFLLPLRNGWLRHSYLLWYFVIIHAMAAWFAYLLCRDLGRSRLASTFGALLFACAGYMGTNDWPQMINGAVWLPLVFLFLLRTLRRPVEIHSAALSGMFLGIAWLSGHHQVPIFSTLAAGAVWLATLVRRRDEWKRLIPAGAVWALTLGLTSGLQSLPAYEYGKLAVRWVGAAAPVGWADRVPYSVHGTYSLGFRSLYGIVVPEVWLHAVPFIGVTAASLAVLAIASGWRDPRVKLFTAVAAGGFAFALGGNSLFHGIVYGLIPIVDKARTPAMAIVVFHLGASILATFGVDSLRVPGSRVWLRRLSAILAAGAVAMLLVLLAILLAYPAAYRDERLVLPVIAGLGFAVILFAASRGALTPVAAGVLAIGLMTLEVGNVSGYHMPNRLDPNVRSLLAPMAQDTDIVDFLRRQRGPFRIETDSQVIPFNFGDWHALEAANGYLASLTSNVNSQDAFTDRAIRLLNVRYSVGVKPTRFGQREVFSGSSGRKVFENPDVLPRAWTVHRVVSQPSADAIRLFLEKPENDPRDIAVIQGAVPELEGCSGGDAVTILERKLNSMDLLATMKCRGLVIVSDTRYPGWVATVDGAERPILEVNGMMRGVVVEGGQHRIRMQYRPRSVVLGALMTVLGIAVALVLSLRARRQRPTA